MLPGLLLVVASLLPAYADDPAAAPTAVVATGGQRIVGQARMGRVLHVRTGRWTTSPDSVSVRWLRDGVPITPVRKASRKRYEATWEDVGHRLSVQITAVVAGQPLVVDTAATKRVKNLHDVHRVVHYEVRTRGDVTADVAEFKRLAQQTYDDPRGWRAAGIRFVRVRSGGSMTLWLASADELPRFSSTCSSEWSCRVGRNVVINQDRWLHASPSWNADGGSLRDYRNMVVNHETGHFLGFSHAACPSPGALAPVMMQQSKGLGGCRFNPWPTSSEISRAH